MPTWGPVAKVTYGLLHPEEPWSSFSRQRASYYAALRSITVVNVKKIAGGATSNWKELEAAYKENEDGLWNQIEDAKPDVVIGGNVLWLFRQRLEWKPPRLPKLGDATATRYASIRQSGRVWVHAHHPAHRGVHERYYERIRDAIREAPDAAEPR